MASLETLNKAVLENKQMSQPTRGRGGHVGF